MSSSHQAAETALDRGRAFYQGRSWADAFQALSEANGITPLAPADLQLLALSAALTGHDDEFLTTLERLHGLYLEEGAFAAAARAAFWLGFRLMSLGEMGQSAGWMSRVQRLVEREGRECAAQGFLLVAGAFRAIAGGDLAAAYQAAERAAAIGERCQDRDLEAFARQQQGRVLLRQGRLEQGLALLDEAMLAAKAGEVSPVMTGLLYCGAIAGCHHVYAFDRAREWTAALSDWCQAQPQLVSFTGTCLAHRAEILQLGGSWPEAIAEAERATERCRAQEQQVAASALYQQAEIHRLRGDVAAAEAAYRSASQQGLEPQPGLALLRLAQGDQPAAASAIRRVVGATADPLERTRYLPAQVEIALAGGDLPEARGACEQLEASAGELRSEVLGAIAAHARGSIRLAEDDPAAALPPLRQAFALWQRIGAPYLAARVRVAVGRACRALGDDEGAGLECQAARELFERLGARPDVAVVQALQSGPASPAVNTPASTHGLTARELQVLRLVAQGKTNRAIAGELGLSEKTVDRHVSNIFNKVDVSTRSAATAFAYQHQLV
jgi:DNA-binding CsgD family transcriptional regulator